MAEPTPEFKEDTRIYPIMLALLECVENELLESGLGVPGFSTVQPGAEVALAHIDTKGDGQCGELWIRLADAYSSRNFPIEDDLTTANARANQSPTGKPGAFVLEVGIARCTGDMDGLDEPDVLLLTRQGLADMAAIRRGICACLGSGEAERRFSMGHWTPYGPEGGAFGGNWQVTVSDGK